MAVLELALIGVSRGPLFLAVSRLPLAVAPLGTGASVVAGCGLSDWGSGQEGLQSRGLSSFGKGLHCPMACGVLLAQELN